MSFLTHSQDFDGILDCHNLNRLDQLHFNIKILISNMDNEYVHYGCGQYAPIKWRNFDASPTLRFEQIPIIGKLYTRNESRFPHNVEYGDIVSGLPVLDESCKGVYCSHILEHLSLEDFRVALKNTHKILKNGGCFRLVIPDLEHSVKKYIDNPSSDASMIFIQETYLGRKQRNRGIKGTIQEYLGNSHHLWMWDYKSILEELKNAGFTNVRRAEFADSDDQMFKDVEDEGRWENCLGVESRK